MKKYLDYSWWFFFGLIVLLFFTGGYRYTDGKLKLELSQIDAFAWGLLALSLLRLRVFKKPYPDVFEKTWKKFLAFTEKKHGLVFLGIALVCIGLQTLNSIWRYHSFHANTYDLSYILQPLWATLNYKFLHSSLAINQTYLGEHFSPILAVVGALFAIWNNVHFVFFFQGLCFFLAALVMYRTSLKLGNSKAVSALVGILFLFYQPIRQAFQFDFREDNFFPLLFSLSFYFLISRAWSGFWLTVLLSWLTKENAPLFTVFMGIWFVLANKWVIPESSEERAQRRFHGYSLILLSTLCFWVVHAKLTPYFSGGIDKTRFAFRLSYLGTSVEDVVRLLFSNPYEFLHRLSGQFLQKKNLKYFLIVFLPFLPFVKSSPWLLGIAFTGFLMNIVMDITSVGFHYECIFTAFLFAALKLGIQKYKIDSHAFTKVWFVVLSFMLFYGRSPVEALRLNFPSPHDRFLEKTLASQIPPAASITTQTSLHPHLTMRPSATLFTEFPPQAEYVVVDLSEAHTRYGNPNLDAFSERLLRENHGYNLVFNERNIRIWKKQLSEKPLQD